MKKTLKLLSLIMVFALILTACSQKDVNDNGLNEIENSNQVEQDEYGISLEDEYIKFVDGRGEKVKITSKPEKVVVLFASFIDIWLRNGGELVGMVEPSEGYIMPSIEGVKTVGTRASISLEEVIALDPDLVILSSNTSAQLDMIAPLEGAGVEVMALDYSYKEDYFKISKLFAMINDKLDNYENQAKNIRDGIQEIINKIPEEDNPTAIIITSTKSNISVRTANTTLGEMFKDLKVINIADLSNSEEGNKDFSLEKILEDDPDFIFVQTLGSDLDAVKKKLKTDVQSNSAWNSLSAVKNDRYIILAKDLYTYKANHRYKDAYEELAKILYPEIFN